MNAVLENTLLESVIGHTQEREFLRRLLKKSAVPHALLFSGSAGIGKRTLARAFASTLLTPESDDSSQETMRLVSAGNHPDLHFVSREVGKKDITVEAIRTLCNSLQLKPYYAHASVALIDNAHYMNLSAANALLKTLEEPNDNSYLILITDSPHRLPETIISRCQVIHFADLSPTDCSAVIVQNLSSMVEQTEIDPLISLAGSTLTPLGLETYVNEKTLELPESKALRDHLHTLLQDTVSLEKALLQLRKQADEGRALSLASQLAADKENLPAVWRLLSATIRKQLRLATGKRAERLSELLLNSLEAERLSAERNLSPQLQLSSILLQIAVGN